MDLGKMLKEWKSDGYQKALNDILNICKNHKEQANDTAKSYEGEESSSDASQSFGDMIKGIESVEKEIKRLKE